MGLSADACNNMNTMADATHATVTTLRRDPSKAAEQKQALQQMVERGGPDFPGFVSGLWIRDPAASETVLVFTFDSLEAAEAYMDTVRNRSARQAAHGLELLSVRVYGILHAV